MLEVCLILFIFTIPVEVFFFFGLVIFFILVLLPIIIITFQSIVKE